MQDKYLKYLSTGGKTTRDLVLHFMVSGGNAAKILKKLRNAGLIERVSLHSIETGKRLTQHAKIPDLRVLTTISWRAQFLPATSNGVSLREII